MINIIFRIVQECKYISPVFLQDLTSASIDLMLCSDHMDIITACFSLAIDLSVNNFIWGVPAMICIIGVGLYLSIRTNFLQIRKFPYAIRVTIGRMLRKREASDGSLTPFQAVCTALAATVGTGNIAGVAGAIAIGGPGAVFWMWISALLGMCTKFSEVTLAVHFRRSPEPAVGWRPGLELLMFCTEIFVSLVSWF